MIDVVVVNWNSNDSLTRCVDSLELNAQTYILKKIIVDNDSNDGSYLVAKNTPGIILLHAMSNLGFGKACNLGVDLVESEYILFLNPDAALLPDSLDKVLAFMQDPKNDTVGICGVQLLDEAGHISRSCARFPTPIGFLTHSIGLGMV